MLPVQVACFDDDADTRATLKALINHTPGLSCVGTFDSADRLVSEAIERRADVILLDLNMPGADPLSQLHELKKCGVPVKAIILSGMNTEGDPELLDADACLNKCCEPSLLLDTILRLGS